MSGVLVATDLSDASDEAILQAHAWAVAHHAALTVVFVMPTMLAHGTDPLFPQDALRSTLDVPALEARAAANARDRVQRLTNRADVPVLVRIGVAHTEIEKAAAETDADLIVMGSHGRTGLARMLLGSNAERVAKAASCNVLVARTPGRLASEAPPVVVVGTDLTEASDAALDLAAREATRRSARLVAVHAMNDARALAYAELAAAFGVSSLGSPPELEAEVHAALSNVLAKKLANTNVIGEVVLPYGEPARAVVGVAESMGAEVLVIGAGQKTTLERLAIGSVAEKIVRHAHCSVLLARKHGRA